MLAWSASEAVIRDLLTAEGIPNDSITSAGFVLDQAVFNGIISRDDHDLLNHFLKYRNAIVHGFIAPDFNENLVTELLETIKRIEKEAAMDNPSNGQPPSTS